MYQYKIGTQILQMLTRCLLIFTPNYKDVWTGTHLIKKLSPKEIKLQSKPWISTEIFKLIKDRNKIFARKKRQPNNANTKRLYYLFRNRAAREIKKSKKIYYSEYFEMNKMNIKKIWSGIREIVNIRNNISTKITQLNINGKIIDNPKDVANQLNDFFVNVGPLTESSIPRWENISPNKFLKKRNQFDFFLAHVSHDEVFKIIKTLQNKSAGPASIPVKLLKLTYAPHYLKIQHQEKQVDVRTSIP